MGASALAAACERSGVPVEVTSAGFLFDGRPASDNTRSVMRARGHDLAAHRSRVVGAAVLDGIDLVLTMERRHARDLVLEHEPVASVHTFKGFAALASAFVLGPPEQVAALHGDLRAFVRAIDATRGPAALVGDGHPDEVEDPHGRSSRVHRKTADELTAAADAIAAAFALAQEQPA